MGGPLAEAAVQRVIDECQARLNDFRATDTATLHRLTGELEAALPDAPAHLRAIVFSLIGLCRYKLGDVQLSLDAHANAARLEPFSASHQNNIGACLVALGRPAEAIEYLRRARSLVTASRTVEIRSLVNEVEALSKLGDSAGANKAFANAVRRTLPDDALNFLNLARCAADLGRENDCAEMLARFFAAAGKVPRGDELAAAEFIRQHFADAVSRAEPEIQQAVRRVLDRWEAATPEQYEERALVRLGPEAWAAFCEAASLMSGQ